MIRRAVTVATAAAALVVGGGAFAHAEGHHAAHPCRTVQIRVPGQPAGESLAALWRADKRDYVTYTVAVRYSARQRWSYVSAVPKHC